MNKAYIMMVVIGTCLGAVSTIEAMNVPPCASLQNGAVQVLYHEQRGHDGHILNLEITENDIREFLCLKKAEKKVASVPQSTSDNKTVKTKAGKTIKYYISGYKAKNSDCFFKFNLRSK